MLNVILFWLLFFVLIYFFTKKERGKNEKHVKSIEESEKNHLNLLRRKELRNYFDDRLSYREKEMIYDIFEKKCFKCSSEKNLCIDHHLPISKGYPLKDEKAGLNAVLLCKKCNGKKQNKLPGEFYNKEELLKLENLGIKSHIFYSPKRIKEVEKNLLSYKLDFLRESIEKKDKIKFVYLDQNDILFTREVVEIHPSKISEERKLLYRGWIRDWYLFSEEDKERSFNIRWIYHLERSSGRISIKNKC